MPLGLCWMPDSYVRSSGHQHGLLGQCTRSIALPICWAPWKRDLLEVGVLYKKLYQPVLDAHVALGSKASLGVACLFGSVKHLWMFGRF